MPILPWVLNFWVVFDGCCPPLASSTWGNVGVLRRFGLVRPAKPPRSCEPDSRGARGEADAKGCALRGGPPVHALPLIGALFAGMLKTPVKMPNPSQSKTLPSPLLPFGALTVPLARGWFAR